MEIKESAQTSDAAASLVEVRRGSSLESRHRGHLAVVDGDGKIIAAVGSPDAVTYLRSSGKPFQVIPTIMTGAADRFGFDEREIAIACGSHSGEPVHVEVVRSMLGKIGLDQTALKCGTHIPFSVQVAQELAREGKSPNVLQNNCSGKHAAMLGLALHLSAPTETYDQLSNPVQQQILSVISEFSDVHVDQIAIGTDGCGVPVFGMTVKAMALMYARLVSSLTEESKRAVSAMIKFPEMVGGSKDRLDTELIRLGKGRLISKIGAEGVYTVGVLPCDEWPRGLGLALKIEDGDDRRARPPAVIEALRQLGVLDNEFLSALRPYSLPAITNHRGELVGEVRAAFQLEMS